MKTIKIFIVLFITFVLGSCSDWIDIKPSDRLSEDVLFVNKEGFQKALNGVYVELAVPALYGSSMTASILDAMAGYYYMTSSTHPYFYYTTFDYTQNTSKNGFDDIWKKAYELIVNCNVILEKCGNGNPALQEPYFGIIKGESLALRAMLHFDLLRLFGPAWSEENKSQPCIPYTISAKHEITPLLSSEQIINLVIKDLNDAMILLQNSDPILTEGVRNTANPSGSNDLYFRQYRMNYYAVKALLARAYIWKEDKTNAFLTAKEILAEVQAPGKEIFPFVTNAAAIHATQPDKMFSTEVFFAVYTINRIDMYNTLFAAERDVQARLSFNGGNADRTRVNALYDDQNDYRHRIWEDVNVAGVSILTNQKYKDYTDAPGRYMIPVIRLGEILLMAAECSDDLNEGIQYLNTLRTKRNCFSLFPASSDDLNTAITSEFRKEMIGEGQMFFYYKRNAMQTIPNHAALTGNKTMVLGNYTVPLPDSEISQRKDNN